MDSKKNKCLQIERSRILFERSGYLGMFNVATGNTNLTSFKVGTKFIPLTRDLVLIPSYKDKTSHLIDLREEKEIEFPTGDEKEEITDALLLPRSSDILTLHSRTRERSPLSTLRFSSAESPGRGLNCSSPGWDTLNLHTCFLRKFRSFLVLDHQLRSGSMESDANYLLVVVNYDLYLDAYSLSSLVEKNPQPKFSYLKESKNAVGLLTLPGTNKFLVFLCAPSQHLGLRVCEITEEGFKMESSLMFEEDDNISFGCAMTHQRVLLVYRVGDSHQKLRVYDVREGWKLLCEIDFHLDGIFTEAVELPERKMLLLGIRYVIEPSMLFRLVYRVKEYTLPHYKALDLETWEMRDFKELGDGTTQISLTLGSSKDEIEELRKIVIMEMQDVIPKDLALEMFGFL